MRRLFSIAAAIAVAGLAAQAAPATGPLDTGFVATPDFVGPNADLAFTRARAARASFIRIGAAWSQIASKQPAPGSDARDPANPVYDWSVLDATVAHTRASKMTPIVDIVGAPQWAWGRTSSSEPGKGTIRPSLTALAAFTAAMTERYSGRTSGLPWVRYWELWNEPNLSSYLRPQLEAGRVVSASWYRAMTNVFYKAVHAAHGRNAVIAGGLSPFTVDNGSYVGVGPLRFMRELLCMSADDHPRPTCARKTQFDIWAHHPYTSGGPTHSAANPDDASLGDLPEMKRLLDAAVRAQHVVSKQKVRFWVDEFSWDSQPGDPKGVPARLHARWVSEALYRMWQSGVSMVTWFNLRDDSFDPGGGFCQCGLYERNPLSMQKDPPKLSLEAFRFPFVAFTRKDGTVSFWGRTPDSNALPLAVEQEVGSRWVIVGSAVAGKRGIFAGTVRPRSSTAPLRARIGATGSTDEASVPFSLIQPPDLPLCAFGSC